MDLTVKDKAEILIILKEKGYNVPIFQVCNDFSRPVIDKSLQGCESFAIRSSPPRSMPGILTTKLNVQKKEIYNALEVVRASWNSPEAKLYREDKKIRGEMRVIIQEMVQADLYGGARKGESGVIINISSLPDGVTSGVDSREEIITAVNSICEELSILFQAPQEIEFAIKDNKVILLQSRQVRRKNRKENMVPLCRGRSFASNSFAAGMVVEEDYLPSCKFLILRSNNLELLSYETIRGVHGIVSQKGNHCSHIMSICMDLGIPLIGSLPFLPALNSFVELDTVNEELLVPRSPSSGDSVLIQDVIQGWNF